MAACSDLGRHRELADPRDTAEDLLDDVAGLRRVVSGLSETFGELSDQLEDVLDGDTSVENGTSGRLPDEA